MFLILVSMIHLLTLHFIARQALSLGPVCMRWLQWIVVAVVMMMAVVWQPPPCNDGMSKILLAPAHITDPLS